MLEVKLNIALEVDLISQLKQYIYSDYICLSKNSNEQISIFEKDFMFVIDVYSLYKYIVNSGELIKMFDLDEIKSKDDIIIKMRNAVL